VGNCTPLSFSNAGIRAVVRFCGIEGVKPKVLVPACGVVRVAFCGEEVVLGIGGSRRGRGRISVGGVSGMVSSRSSSIIDSP